MGFEAGTNRGVCACSCGRRAIRCRGVRCAAALHCTRVRRRHHDRTTRLSVGAVRREMEPTSLWLRYCARSGTGDQHAIVACLPAADAAQIGGPGGSRSKRWCNPADGCCFAARYRSGGKYFGRALRCELVRRGARPCAIWRCDIRRDPDVDGRRQFAGNGQFRDVDSADLFGDRCSGRAAGPADCRRDNPRYFQNAWQRHARCRGNGHCLATDRNAQGKFSLARSRCLQSVRLPAGAPKWPATRAASRRSKRFFPATPSRGRRARTTFSRSTSSSCRPSAGLS